MSSQCWDCAPHSPRNPWRNRLQNFLRSTSIKRPPKSPSMACWLVVGPPLWKNMNVNWDDEIPNIWENKKCSKPPTSLYTLKPSPKGGLLIGLSTDLSDRFPLGNTQDSQAERGIIHLSIVIHEESRKIRAFNFNLLNSKRMSLEKNSSHRLIIDSQESGRNSKTKAMSSMPSAKKWWSRVERSTLPRAAQHSCDLISRSCKYRWYTMIIYDSCIVWEYHGIPVHILYHTLSICIDIAYHTQLYHVDPISILACVKRGHTILKVWRNVHHGAGATPPTGGMHCDPPLRAKQASRISTSSCRRGSYNLLDF